jgi:flagellar hook-length control protein FliK
MAAVPAGPTAAELPTALTREAAQPVAALERAAVSVTSLSGQQTGDRPVLVPSANPAVSGLPGGQTGPPPTVVVREAAQPASLSVARQLTEVVMFQVRRSQAGTGQVLRVQVAFDPPQLGRVTLELTFGRNGLDVQFHTPDRVVKAIIEQALPQLREALIRQEFNLGNTTVFLGQGNSQEQSARLFRGPWTGNPASDEFVSEPSDDKSRAEPVFDSGLDYLV